MVDLGFCDRCYHFEFPPTSLCEFLRDACESPRTSGFVLLCWSADVLASGL